MASSTLAIPTSYHQSTLSTQKPKLETKVRSEDELLKFFLHGSYDVQRGNISKTKIDEINHNQTVSIPNEIKSIDEDKTKSRCMFEETYMINISVKQPDTKPSSKQIDVRIEKALSDTQINNNNEKIDDDDEISSIFDEEEVDHEEVDSVIFNEIDSTTDISTTKLTLADMINKTLTTIPASSLDNLNKLPNNWYVEQTNERKKSEEIVKTPSPAIQKATLTTNISEDEKLFEYLDYLETKEESKQQPNKSSSTTTKSSKSNKIPSKSSQQDSIPILDLEQLCRSLTVNDLKDELIRKKIYELKLLIDQRHKKIQNQIPLTKPRKDNLPILIAMPPVAQQRRRTTLIQSSTLLQSKSGQLQAPYNSPDIVSNYNPKQSPLPFPIQRSINSTRKYHYT